MFKQLRQVAVLVAGCLVLGTAVHGADHDDTPALKAIPRHEARVTDLHVFTGEYPKPGKGPHMRSSLVIALSTNPTIPPSAAAYTFPADLTLQIFVDRHSEVDFDGDR